MLKSEIRSFYKEKRSGLSPNELERISSQVTALVRDSFSFKDKYVSLFLPIERQKEIDTYELLEEIIQQGGQPVVAKSDFSDIESELSPTSSASTVLPYDSRTGTRSRLAQIQTNCKLFLAGKWSVLYRDAIKTLSKGANMP